MGEDRSTSDEEEEGEEGDQDRRKDETGEKGEAADSEDMEKMSVEDAEASADAAETAEEAVDAPAAEMADDAEMGDGEAAAEPWRPRNRPNEPRGPDYKPFTSGSTRRWRPRNCASRRSSTACAAISTSSSRTCRASWRGSPTGCSAA